MNKKKLSWYNLSLLAFSGVWSFGNIINGFATYGGVRAIVPWLITIVLYFIPYSQMVGELGSTFSGDGGGVSSWIKNTIGPKAAYLAGWTYWIVHMPYISQKPSKIIVACGWIIFGDNRAQSLPTIMISIISLAIIALVIALALQGINFLKKIASIAGMASFVLSMLYIVMMFSAKAVGSGSFTNVSLSFDTYKPEINGLFFLNLSILLFALGGCEKTSPYVNQMKKPGKDYPLGMIILAIMTAVSAILGTIAMGMMFDSNNIPKDLITNGGYYAFQMLGKHYGLGNFFVIVYALCELCGQLAVLIVSIDAPLKILLDNADEHYIPKQMLKKNKNGIYVNGVKVVAAIVSILIIIPAFGIGEMNELVVWLVKINSVCMPLRYLWVFVAYIGLKSLQTRQEVKADYRFIKNPILGKIMGGWCFLLTATACMMGIYSENKFEMILNIVVPLFLIGLGGVFPMIAKRTGNHN